MRHIGRGQASNCANPATDTWVRSRGRLVDPVSLEYVVYDVSDQGKQLSPVQVYPPTGRAAVNLAACPAGNRIGLGHFVGPFTPQLTAAFGAYEVRWYCTVATGDTETEWSTYFDVVTGAVRSRLPTYASVSSLRREGVEPKDADDSRALELLVRASQYIERVTGRFFEPRALTIEADGKGRNSLLLDFPIIALESVAVDGWPWAAPASDAVDLDIVRVYNRHLDGLTMPDDRSSPKLDFYRDVTDPISAAIVSDWSSMRWPRGQQNVRVAGAFGYTDPDGSPAGATPELLAHVTRLLVVRELGRLMDRDAREDAQRRWRILSERTRDQSYTLMGPGGGAGTAIGTSLVGAFTGDPEIDSTLAMFIRPPDFGAV